MMKSSVTVFCRKLISYIIIFTTCHTFICGTFFSKAESVTLHRSAKLLGFHRILVYNVTLNEGSGESRILIEEKLPKDIYVDPYQLLKLIKENKLRIISDKQISTELPAYESEPFNVLFCSHSKTNFHELELPIHLRYQKPHQCDVLGEYVRVTLGAPNVYIRSRSKKSAVSSEKDSMCHPDTTDDNSWVQIPIVELETHFEVPVGCTEHLYPVLFLTVSVIGLATFYLCYVLVNVNKT